MSEPSANPDSNSRPTLVAKLLRSVLPVVFLSLLVGGAVNYFVARAQIAHDIRGEIQTLADQVAVNTRNFVEQRGRDLETIAENPLLNDYHMNAAYGLDEEARTYQRELSRYFATFSRRTGAYEAILYFDAAGDLVAGVERGEVIRREDRTAFDPGVMKNRDEYRSPLRSASHGKTMTLATRLRGEAGDERGVIALVCDLDPMADMLARTQVGETGRAYLAGHDDQPLLGGPPEGEPDLRQTAPVAAAPWRVVVEAHSSDFLGPLVRLRNLTILYSLAVAGLVTLLISTGIQRATRPIHRMAEGTRRLASGDLDYRFDDPPLRELAPLALGFNDMAANLKLRDEQLEARIRQLSALRLMEGAATRRAEEEPLLRTCLEAVAKGLDFQRVGLYWVDEEEGRINGRFTHFRGETALTEASFRTHSVSTHSDDILARVARTRQAALVLDPATHPGVNPRFVRETETQSFILTPLCGKDRVFGILCADNTGTDRPLSGDDRDGLTLFASTAGLAIENAALLRRIAESEARHRTVLENSPIAILGLSRDQRITTWNRGAESIFGYDADWIIGRPLLELFPEDARTEFDQLVMRVVQDGSVREYPIRGRTRSGRMLDMTVSWGGERRDFWENGEWAVVIRDVTEASRLQRQLILSEKLSAAGQLISGIAHELNNPLQAVLGYAQLLEHDRDAEAARGHVHRIHESATRCRKIIDNLLLFVRQGGVEKRPISAVDAARASIELLSHKLRKASRVELTAHFEDEAPYVRANFQQVEQVLINLINNACDAMENQSGERRVDLRVRPAGPRVRIEVADTGPGIPAEARERLFEPFFTTKGEGRGTGLGLPLCRDIVAEHGGELGVSDREGGGSVFHFELNRVARPADTADRKPSAEPRTRPERQAEAQASSAPAAAATSPAPAPRVGRSASFAPVSAGHPAGRRILVVDDEPSVRALLRDVLEADGHRVQLTGLLEEARDYAAAETFDLVLSDINLDDGSGVGFFQHWSQATGRARPPFLFLTGDIAGGAAGALADEPNQPPVLQKPIALNDLRDAVASLLADTPREQTTA